MAWAGKTDPRIRLGLGRKAALQVEDVELANVPEQGNDADQEFDFAPLLKQWKLTSAEAQLFALRYMAGIPRKEAVKLLAWDKQRFHRAEVGLSWKRRNLNREAMKRLNPDFDGGSSKKLSFQRNLRSGRKLWNLKPLDHSFQQVMTAERTYAKRKF